MKLKTARIAIWSCMAAVVLFGLLLIVTQSKLMFALLMLALAGELILFFVFIRCPHCGRHLDRTGLYSSATHCPFCGKPLEDAPRK